MSKLKVITLQNNRICKNYLNRLIQNVDKTIDKILEIILNLI